MNQHPSGSASHIGRQRGFSNLLTAFAFSVVAVAGMGLLTYRAASDFMTSSRLVQRTYAELEALQALDSALYRTVNAVRAYLMAGDGHNLDEYHALAATLQPAAERAAALLAGDPPRLAQLQDLSAQIARRHEFMDQAVAAYQAGGLPEVVRLNRTPQVREVADAVQSLMLAVQADQSRLLRERIATDEGRISQLRGLVGIFLVVSLFMLVLFYRRSRQDAARRRSAELESERQRRVADTIIENAPVGVFLKEARGLTMLRINRALEALTGNSRQNALGKSDPDFMPAGMREMGERYLQVQRDLINRRQMHTVEEFEMPTPQGRRALRVQLVLIPGESGQIEFLLGLSEDITERQQAEQRQREIAEALERKSRELEAANKELESFSYSVSHDLRAPLRAMEGYAAILDEDYGGQLDDEGRRFLRHIRESAARLGRLILDLLALSRLGRQPLSVGPVDARHLVQGVWDELRATHPATRATLQLEELPPCEADAALLRQAFVNLLDNAMKYSSKVDAPLIQVSGRQAGSEIIYSVADNGVGFDMRYYDKLFNVFQRLHSEADYPGTGVGLAIVHRVIARHGGRAWAQSEPTGGATFFIAVPAVAQAHSASGTPPP